MDKWQQWWINSAWACQNPALESINRAVLKTDGFSLSFIPFQSRDANEATSLFTMTLTHCVLTPARSWTDAGSECQHTAAFPQDSVIITKTTKKHEFSCWIMTALNCNRHQSYVVSVIRYLHGIHCRKLNYGDLFAVGGKAEGCWDELKSGKILQAWEPLYRIRPIASLLWQLPKLGRYQKQVQSVQQLAAIQYGNFSWGNLSFNCSS